jgi:hypothetical protein
VPISASFFPTRRARFLRVVAGELWLASCGWRVVAGCLRGCFRERVCAVGEDILLSEREGGWGEGNGRAACVKRNEREQARGTA